MKTETELLQEARSKLPDPSECSLDFILVPVFKNINSIRLDDPLDKHMIVFKFYKHKLKGWVLESHD